MSRAILPSALIMRVRQCGRHCSEMDCASRMMPAADTTGHRLRPSRGRTLVISAVLIVWCLASGSLPAAPHPSLIDPAKTRCITCHKEVLGGSIRHAVVDTCEECHQFSMEEGRTIVELAAPQPTLCVTCHSDLEEHAEGAVAVMHVPVTDSCLNCHDPHGSEVARLLHQPVPDGCLTCHDPEDLNETHGVSVSRAPCTECHEPHGSMRPALMTSDEQHPPFAERSCEACHRRGLGTRARRHASEICFACHDSAPLLSTHVHTAVEKGRCLGCHDPHMSDHSPLLEAQGVALCASCHSAVIEKTTLSSAHQPAVDGCDTCHQPHAAEHEFQLLSAVPDLCSMCHDVDDAEIRDAHLDADLSAVRCTSCHDPHGSAEAPLIASRSIHPPFTDGSCETCHEGSTHALIEDGTSALCLACHSEIEEVVTTSTVPHDAIEAVDCSECHNAHASSNSRLVRTAGGLICADCHDDKLAGEDEFPHGAISRIGCQSCHEPHGSERDALLRVEDVNELCLGCHDRRRWTPGEESGTILLLSRFDLPETELVSIRTLELTSGTHDHPVLHHRTIGTITDPDLSIMQTAELGCLSCHDPHKGLSPSLFASGATDICGRCHEK